MGIHADRDRREAGSGDPDRRPGDRRAGAEPAVPGPDEQGADEQGRYELLGLLAVLWRSRTVVFGVPALVGLAAAGFVWVCKTLPPAVSPLPDVFLASAAILIEDPQPGASDLQTLLGAADQGAQLLGSLAPRAGYGALAVALLDSRSTIDPVVADFDLIDRYGIRRHARAASREEFRTRARFTHDPATGIVTVAFRDYDPTFAMEVANRLVDILTERFEGLEGLHQAQDMALTAHRRQETKREIERVEEDIKEFQLRYGVLSVGALAGEHSERLAVVRAQLTLKEVEIRSYAALTRIDDPLLAKLHTERDSLLTLLAEMESGYAEFAPAMPAQDELPDLALEFARLQRELLVLTEVYSALTVSYELSRVEVGTTEPVFQVLERADEPDRKHGPRWRFIVVGAVLCASIATVSAVLLVNALRGVMADPSARQRFRRPRE